MIQGQATTVLADAETECRRRLAATRSARGSHGDDIPRQIEDFLRKGVKLRLNVEQIMRDAEEP